MARYWSLGNFENTGPQFLDQKSQQSTKNKRGHNDHHLMGEVLRWPANGPAPDEPAEAESRVEKAMRRNAPDLAGAPIAEQLAAHIRNTAHLEARWPRPRFIALIGTMVLATVVPTVTLRLMLWGLILFLLMAVLVGPERARDAMRIVLAAFMRLWRHEIVVARRLVRGWY